MTTTGISEPADRTVVRVEVEHEYTAAAGVADGWDALVFFERDDELAEACGNDDGDRWYCVGTKRTATWATVEAIAEEIQVMVPGEVLRTKSGAQPGVLRSWAADRP